MDIDLVYLWVDGSDPEWQAKRSAFLGAKGEETSADCKGRYADNGELKYSLRSVEKYAPWIRKIFIVTDAQVPGWLDTSNPKIQIVDHKEILPPESLPCFNSTLLEMNFHKIPGLSEHFIYSNDDMFINKPVAPETFFASDGLPIARLRRTPLRKTGRFFKERILGKPLNNYSRKIANAADLVCKKYGVYYRLKPHHNMDAYLKSDCQRVVEQVFRAELEAGHESHIRNDHDIQRVVYYYVALAEKRAHLHRTPRKESLQVRIHSARKFKELEDFRPTLFCLNDSEHAGDEDRNRTKALMERYYPEKSGFEK